MADVVDAVTRSRMMAGIRGRDTQPERQIRSGLHRLGFRFRLNATAPPGRPDIVLPRYRAAVFVHGCFWHGHDCELFRWPATRPAFWRRKITTNRRRDRSVRSEVRAAGWRQLVIWECAIKGRGGPAVRRVVERSAAWLRSSRQFAEIRGKHPR